jgi:hypothetical protein
MSSVTRLFPRTSRSVLPILFVLGVIMLIGTWIILYWAESLFRVALGGILLLRHGARPPSSWHSGKNVKRFLPNFARNAPTIADFCSRECRFLHRQYPTRTQKLLVVALRVRRLEHSVLDNGFLVYKCFLGNKRPNGWPSDECLQGILPHLVRHCFASDLVG